MRNTTALTIVKLCGEVKRALHFSAVDEQKQVEAATKMIESHQNRINQIRSSFKRILRAKEGIDYADIGSIQHMVEEAFELDEGDLMHYVNEVKDKSQISWSMT